MRLQSHVELVHRSGHLAWYRLVKDKQTGMCIYFRDGRCANYEERPLECQLYPWVITWDKNRGLSLRQHSGCLSRIIPERPSIPEEALKVPSDWWEGFEKLPD